MKGNERKNAKEEETKQVLEMQTPMPFSKSAWDCECCLGGIEFIYTKH